MQAKSRAYATEQIALQKEDFKRLGVLGEWDNPYLTMNPGNEADEIRALKRIMERGFVYRGLKPVYWCFDCASSLAEFEIEYADKKSQTLDVAFKAHDAARLADGNFQIPMVGMIQSLNVSVACAVSLFEALRQRTTGRRKSRSKFSSRELAKLLKEWSMR